MYFIKIGFYTEAGNYNYAYIKDIKFDDNGHISLMYLNCEDPYKFDNLKEAREIASTLGKVYAGIVQLECLESTVIEEF